MTSRPDWSEPLVRRLIAKHKGMPPELIIERYADKLRADAEQNRLAVKPRVIASVLGIRHRAAEYDFAGRIYAEKNGQLVMNINSADIAERQHFTEAHELMHTAFPGFRLEGRYRSDALAMERQPPNREEEYLCDYGAAALLMPAPLVRGEYTVSGGLSDAERLSGDAEVSVEAAANRLVALADEPAILMCLAIMHKPADRAALRRGQHVEMALRVRYATGSPHLAVYVPRFKSADRGSVLSAAAEDWRCREAVETLPGVPNAGRFRLQAKRYGSDGRARVLAIGRPTA